jgi:hypothetical protein
MNEYSIPQSQPKDSLAKEKVGINWMKVFNTHSCRPMCSVKERVMIRKQREDSDRVDELLNIVHVLPAKMENSVEDESNMTTKALDTRYYERKTTMEHKSKQQRKQT